MIGHIYQMVNVIIGTIQKIEIIILCLVYLTVGSIHSINNEKHTHCIRILLILITRLMASMIRFAPFLINYMSYNQKDV